MINLQKDQNKNNTISKINNGFFNLSIERIIDGYRKKSITPLDIASICIDRVQSTGSMAKAWVSFSSEKLMQQAEDSYKELTLTDNIKPLHGIPVAIKDIFNTVDFKTEMGSPLWTGFTPGNDARVVYKLKQNGGALIPGKVHTAEFAVHSLGETINPHNILHTPGTSSRGYAVEIALGMVPAAIGTQTAGSIIRPASFCGVYGSKPSFGLIPRTGVLKTTDSLDTIGFFVLHFEDLERVFNVLRVKGLNYPISHKMLSLPERQNKPSFRPWKVALIRSVVDKYAPAYAHEQLELWAKKLDKDKNIEVSIVNLPNDMAMAHDVHATIYDKSLSHYFKREFENKELVSGLMIEAIERGNKISPQQYHGALQKQYELASCMDEFLKNYDVAFSLSTSGAAPLRNELEKMDTALVWTLTYLPVLSAPIFISPNGLPFGVQMFSRRYSDQLLFNFAKYLRKLELIPWGPNPIASII